MIAFFTSFSVFFVSALIIKKVYELLFNHVLGPALFGGIDFKKKGQWAGKFYHYTPECANVSRR